MKKMMICLFYLTVLTVFSACVVNDPSTETIQNFAENELEEPRMTDQLNTIDSPYLGTMIVVPAGDFQRDEQTENISRVDSFSINRTEITRQQFSEVIEIDDPSRAFENDPNDPVQNILWYHTLVFCNYLSLKEQLDPVYYIAGSSNPADWGDIPSENDKEWNNVTANWEANGYRLPTEMEWLWAAMGADHAAIGEINTTGFNKRFAGDTGTENMENYVWYQTNSNARTHPAAEKEPNELGLYDMTGNVWEWCWDSYDVLPEGILDSYRGSGEGEERVLHGGSWHNPAYRCAMAFRLNHTPDFQWSNIGFRVVRNCTE